MPDMSGKRTERSCIIQVRVIPRSSRNKVSGKEGGVYRIKITAAPVEGAANRALRDFLAGRLGLAKRDVEIVSGERARTKRIRVAGLTPAQVDGILSS